jgi:N-methylhydantoinase A
MTPIYDRQKLFSGDEFSGPAIVEQMDTTVVVMPNSRARVDDVGNLVISITEPSV